CRPEPAEGGDVGEEGEAAGGAHGLTSRPGRGPAGGELFRGSPPVGRGLPGNQGPVSGQGGLVACDPFLEGVNPGLGGG
ncbi:MAG TPA: hypothetical protein PKJ21_10535, partial [Anaerolineae bacterium]|nr:hypothetical protein [Anaerolineae bacterium]